jgi:alkylation response protein AidB-like acyl-CoA dehydrogenase
MAYKAPVRDLTFILNEVLEIDRYSNSPGFQDVSSDLVQQILEEGAKFSEEVIAPLNKVGDQEGCKWDNGKVTGPTGWKEAYKAMVEAGWPALSALPEHGGQGMPSVVAMAFGQFTAAASPAFSMYPGLTAGAYWGLNANGSDEQKAMYLPKMASGEWGGTMNLTEPQCGTDLGLIRTKAVPNGDGSYRITGQKIWISAGRARLHRQHHPSGAGPHRGRAGRGQGHQPVRRAQVLPQEDGSLGRAQRRRKPAPASSTRWASTATPPASWPMRRPRAG